MNQEPAIRLVVFLTWRMSISAWNKAGILERELSLYRALLERGIHTDFISYGGPEERKFVDRMPEFGLHFNWLSLPPGLYRRLVPVLHAPTLIRCNLIKTNQFEGGDVAVASAKLWQKLLLARGGYMRSYNLEQDRGKNHQSTRRQREEERRLFLAADGIVVTSQAMAELIGNRLPEGAEKIRVLPNFVDVEAFSSLERQRDIDLLYVGRLSPEKNLDILIEGALASRAHRTVIIGDGPMRETLERKFQGNNDRLSFIGTVPHQDLPEWYAKSRMFGLISKFEGHPKALIEAMASGCVAIGSKAEGIASVIDDGSTGLLLDATPAAVADALNRLSANPSEWEMMSEAARRTARQRYGLATLADEEASLYRLLLLLQ